MKPSMDRRRVTEQLLDLGVERGGVLVVHTAFSNVGPIEDGPVGLIESLEAAVGPYGTLVMPSMTDDDDRPFNPRETPCITMGVVADSFWRRPGILRSDNPHAFAAGGPMAAAIAAPHPLEVPHGADSPIGRVYAFDGQILLLGVGHDANTTIHLAENMTNVRYRRSGHVTVVEEGRPVQLAYSEVDHCCRKFDLMNEWLDVAGRQHRGVVGRGEARLMRSRDVVEASIAHLRSDETAFLHPAGLCTECDEARAGIDTPR